MRDLCGVPRSRIKDDPLLFPLVTLIIMDVFLQKMRIKKNRKVLVIEEAWKAIASPLMAEYIKFMYKTARKFWASVGVVTQEIQDIIGSEIVKEAIINNSDVVMLLDQSKFKERFDTIKAILGLTDVDCKKIFTINRLDNKDGRSFFREVFIRRGTTSGVNGVEEPHECYMTYTTERAEKEALKLYKGARRRKPSGSHRSLLPGLGCQRHQQVPDIRPEGQRGRTGTEPESKTIKSDTMGKFDIDRPIAELFSVEPYALRIRNT